MKKFFNEPTVKFNLFESENDVLAVSAAVVLTTAAYDGALEAEIDFEEIAHYFDL